MRTNRPSPLTRRRLRREGSRAGATQSEALGRRTTASPGQKVVDRDALLETLTQLRDILDDYIERVNDLVVTIPSLQEMETDEWLSADVPSDAEERREKGC